jgi:MFS family permease
MTALAAAVNMAGNLAAGRLQQRGVPAQTLLLTGFAVMGAAALAAFHGGASEGLPPLARYGAVLLFSGVGGLIPATLFTLAVRVAPSEGTLASTVGWVQQWSSLGQMLGPPAVAWVASRFDSWQYTGWVTGACSLAGLALVPGLMRQLRRPPRSA